MSLHRSTREREVLEWALATHIVRRVDHVLALRLPRPTERQLFALLAYDHTARFLHRGTVEQDLGQYIEVGLARAAAVVRATSSSCIDAYVAMPWVHAVRPLESGGVPPDEEPVWFSE